MKIIIVGGGLGGLASYLALKKYLAEISPSVTIKVYESHPDPISATATLGGSISIAPNGLQALSSICDVAVTSLTATGFQYPTFAFRNSRGSLLGHYVSGSKERHGFVQLFVTRTMVHEALLREVPQSAVHWGKNVEKVVETTDNDGVEVQFADGTVEHADLVIGADGLKSVVRKSIFGDEFDAKYKGLTGVGGFLLVSSLPENLREGIMKDPVTFTVGPSSYFAYLPASGFSPEPSSENRISWWSVYESTPPLSRNIPLADLRAQLLERYDSWKSPYDIPKSRVFPSIISVACEPEQGNPELAVERGILILPQYAIKRLPRWCSSSGKVILLGDAAHPVPPESGQGVSCAVEDGLALALFLEHYLGQHSTSPPSKDVEALKQTAAAYEAVRMRRIAMILNIGKFQSSTSIAQTWWWGWIRDWVLWILCEPNHFVSFRRVVNLNLPGKLPASVNDGMFGYDVPAEVQTYLSSKPTHP